MLSWMLYAIGLTLVLGFAAALWERAAIVGGRPARWGWVSALLLSAAVPVMHALWPMSAAETIIAIAADPAATTTIWDSHRVLALPAESASAIFAWLPRHWPVWAWMLASILAAVYFGLGYLSIRRESRSARRAVIADRAVLITTRLGPAVVGWVRPTILVPEWINRLAPSQRDLVVIHEDEHVRANDIHLLGVGILLLIVVPWNPVLWWLFVRLRLAIEIDCDARVLQSRPDAVHYGQVLLDASTLAVGRARGLPALLESTSSLEKRVRVLLRQRTTRDRSAFVLLAMASAVVGIAAASMDTPRTNPWAAMSGGVSAAQPYVLSPQRQLEEQWASLAGVIGFFEPMAQQASGRETAYVFLIVDAAGRVASHHSELRPSFDQNALSAQELKRIFEDKLDHSFDKVPMLLQVRLGDAGRRSIAVVLAVDAQARALGTRAPSVDLSAIRNDAPWMQQALIRRTQNERALIRMADAGVIDAGLPAGSELWVVLDPDGRYVASGRRSVINDPNESRRYVQGLRPASKIGEVSRGTAVRDTLGKRIQVTWHWLVEGDASGA